MTRAAASLLSRSLLYEVGKLLPLPHPSSPLPPLFSLPPLLPLSLLLFSLLYFLLLLFFLLLFFLQRGEGTTGTISRGKMYVLE